jgi:hypothetical protein
MLVVRLAHVATAIEDQTREADPEQHERGGHGNRGQVNIIDEDGGRYRSFCNFPHSKARRKCSGTRQGKRNLCPVPPQILGLTLNDHMPNGTAAAGTPRLRREHSPVGRHPQ